MDTRPATCRYRLQDAGRYFPMLSCDACGKTFRTGLGMHCTVGAVEMPERQHKPTIAESEWLQRVIQDHLEPLLEAARSQLSTLERMRMCESCLRMFDGDDPRAYVADDYKQASCAGCNIEANPKLALEALAKALEMNPDLDEVSRSQTKS